MDMLSEKLLVCYLIPNKQHSQLYLSLALNIPLRSLPCLVCQKRSARSLGSLPAGLVRAGASLSAVRTTSSLVEV